MITLYSTGCPKCKVIKKKLELSGREFKVVEDTDEVVKFAEEHNIRELPLLELEDGTVLNFVESNKYLNR